MTEAQTRNPDTESFLKELSEIEYESPEYKDAMKAIHKLRKLLHS